jgi:Zn-dependent M28 family amino/carboxypeptidase
VEFEKDGQPWHHLVIDLPGKNDTLRDEVVIVTANYDTPPNSPGADGNASGVAGLMSLAQSFAGASTDRSLRFVATVHDAPPFAGTDNTGSANYAATLRERREKVAAIISLEGLGCFSDQAGSQKIPATPSTPYPDKGDFLAIVSNPAAEASSAAIRQRLEKHPALPLEFEASSAAGPLLGNTAAWAFDRAGFPVIRVTDTAELRNPRWQQPADTADTLDYPRFLKAVETAEKIISALVNPGR